MGDDRNRCSSCKYWEREKDYYDFGVCKKVIHGMDIILHTGWDGGYVESIETLENFGCVFHIPK